VSAIIGIKKTGDKVIVTTRQCIMCGLLHEVEVDEAQLRRYMEGEFVQKAFPDMSVAERELLVSGTDDECFNLMFPEEDQ
jgi:hypothetical protein